MDLLVAAMQTGRVAAQARLTIVPKGVGRYLEVGTRLRAHCGSRIALGPVLSGKGWTKVYLRRRADPQWYKQQDAKPASCGTTLRAPAPAGIFFSGYWLVLSPL